MLATALALLSTVALADTAQLLIPLQQHAATLEAEENYAEAGRYYTQAIRLAETSLGAFAPQLVAPLTGLGRVLIAQEQLEQAEAPLLRAQGITHRNFGIFATSQDTIIELLTESYHGQGKITAANTQQLFALRTFEKMHPDSPDLVPALHAWARWNASLGRFPKVRDSLDRALAISADHYGPNDLRLLDTLELMMTLYDDRLQRRQVRESERAMQHMVAIYASQPQVDWADLLVARTRMGDWYMLSKSRAQGLRQYDLTVQSAREAGIDPVLIEQHYGAAKVLFMNQTQPQFLGRGVDDDTNRAGVIVIEFDVTKSGRPINLVVIDDTHDNAAITQAALRRVKFSIYRPRFENGRAVVTRQMRSVFPIRRDGAGLVLGTGEIAPPTVKE